MEPTNSQFHTVHADTTFFCNNSFNIILPFTLIDASKEFGLEVNVEKTKYMLVSRDQNAGQNREIKIGKQII
jgi:hypothetical protein